MLKGLKQRLGGREEEDATRAEPRRRTSESGLESRGSEAEISSSAAKSPQSTQAALDGYGLKSLFDPVEPVVAVAE
jgi:hypothetical protein